jgi:hypothetical protein
MWGDELVKDLNRRTEEIAINGPRRQCAQAARSQVWSFAAMA